ncbi:MAG: cytochrome c peroxidase [Planctomycetota bacterium]
MHRAVLAFLCAALPVAAQAFPPPPAPPGNPVTPNKVLLGMALFWEEQMSSTNTVACGTCHIFAAGGSDPRSLTAIHPGADGLFGTADDVRGSPGVPRSQASGAYVASVFGIRAQVTPRKAPTVVNAAYLPKLFWDGRAESGVFRDPVTNQIILNSGAALENLVAQPPVNEIEMAHTGRSWTDVVARIGAAKPMALATNLPARLQTFVQGQSYPQLFQTAFGSAGVDAGRIVMAIATYLRTLVADQSRFDDFLRGTATLTSTEMFGFVHFEGNCRTCHTEANASAFLAGPVVNDFRRTGVSAIPEDLGRGAVTGLVADNGKFRVPTMRNVALRAPFFHDGSAGTLADVLAFYNRGGDFHVGQDPLVPALAGQVPPALANQIIAFLQTLTDPRVQNEQLPFDRPRLWSESVYVPTVLGTGTPGTGGAAPRAVAIEPPFVGNPRFTIGVDRTVGGALHVLGWDVSASAAGTTVIGLQVHLGLTPALTLITAPTPTATGPTGGYGSMTFALPPNPLLAGVTVYGQWLVADPQGPNGFATSDAFALTLF